MTDDTSAALEWLEDLKRTAIMLRTWASVATGEPVYKAVERILDEESAWIARPSPEVTKRIALAATIAAFSAREDDPLYEAAERVWNAWAGGELTDADMRELRDALGLVSAP